MCCVRATSEYGSRSVAKASHPLLIADTLLIPPASTFYSYMSSSCPVILDTSRSVHYVYRCTANRESAFADFARAQTRRLCIPTRQLDWSKMADPEPFVLQWFEEHGAENIACVAFGELAFVRRGRHRNHCVCNDYAPYGAESIACVAFGELTMLQMLLPLSTAVEGDL